jgi:hypothetical protein
MQLRRKPFLLISVFSVQKQPAKSLAQRLFKGDIFSSGDPMHKSRCERLQSVISLNVTPSRNTGSMLACTKYLAELSGCSGL